MINRNKIELNKDIYYVPSYTGQAVKILILKMFDDEIALVKPFSRKKDFKPYPTPIAHIYNTPEAAKHGGRDWEYYMRHRKKK